MTTPTAIITQSQQIWTDYFNRRAAIEAVFAHVATLPSSRTEEKHTLNVYKAGLENFLHFAGDMLPSEDLVARYVAGLKTGTASPSGKPLASSTIGSKYIAPLRLYLSKLAGQHIPVSGAARDLVQDAKEAIRAAAATKTPKADTTTDMPALYAHGNRLTVKQVNAIYANIDTSTKQGLRDLALLYVGFTTGMRLAELRRMTLASIKQGQDCLEIHVRGKRSNMTPVPMDAVAYTLIQEWVSAYNAGLDASDPRYIHPSTPLWQAILAGDNYAHLGVNGFQAKAISGEAIRLILKRACLIAEVPVISPHDMRRTVAAIGRSAGMEFDELRRLLRHKDISTTFKYVGELQNLSKSLITNRVNFALPSKQPRQQPLPQSA